MASALRRATEMHKYMNDLHEWFLNYLSVYLVTRRHFRNNQRLPYGYCGSDVANLIDLSKKVPHYSILRAYHEQSVGTDAPNGDNCSVFKGGQDATILPEIVGVLPGSQTDLEGHSHRSMTHRFSLPFPFPRDSSSHSVRLYSVKLLWF